MIEIQKNIRRIFWFYFVLFAALALYLGKLIFFDSASLTASTLNPRLKIENTTLTRGDILDASGKILAVSEKGKRNYPFGRDFAHLVGFMDYQKAGLAGVEAKYNGVLQTAHNEIGQRLRHFVSGEEVKGNSLSLTVDADLQQYVVKQLGKKKGAVIVMEPSTGKILAMASYPSFDPNHVHENWDSLEADTDNSPLLNRAAQGQYPPGSVFKIITAAAAYENIQGFETSVYQCKGKATFAGKTIHCFDSAVHGEETIQKAFAVSCNTFFANLGLQIGAERLRTTADRLYFNEPIPFPLEYAVSSFPLAKSASESEIIETAIGQGKTMAAPLQIALVTSAVANAGVMMAPYVVDRILDSQGETIQKTLPVMMSSVFTSDEADALTVMMQEVMKTGTGKKAAVKGVSVAAKTGSAQNPSGADHGWFTAFAPVENPEFALCIILENGGGSSQTLGMAKNIMTYLVS